MPELNTLSNALLWVCFIIITVLWSSTWFMIRKWLSENEERHQKHEEKIEQIRIDMVKKAEYRWCEDQMKNRYDDLREDIHLVEKNIKDYIDAGSKK